MIRDYHSLVPMRYHETYVVVEPDDKFHGIETMMRHWRGNLQDVVVFGDGLNDVKMFQQAAFSIAMGNAVAELKQPVQRKMAFVKLCIILGGYEDVCEY